MRRSLAITAGVCVFFAAGLQADTVVTVPFLANMLPQNETPPANIAATGNALILVHEQLDASGALKSGSVEFNINYQFPGANTIIGLHIHKAPAGTPGTIVVPTDVNAASNSVVVGASGAGRINKQVQFGTGAGQPGLDVIQDILAHPDGYYVNIHTADFGSGAMRGQLVPASSTVVMGLMSPANETPPVANSKASAVAVVRAYRAVNASGALQSALVIFDATYKDFTDPTTFTGFHIHRGIAGVPGPVIINTGISASNSVAAGPGGAGSLHYEVPVAPADRTFADEADTVTGLFFVPNGYYINLHDTVNTGGEIRDQLRRTDATTIQVTMQASNETPSISGLNADSPAAIRIYTVHNADGSIAAGAVNFDVLARFPAAATFNGLHIHNGAPGVSGSPTIPTDLGSNNVVSDTGNVTIDKWVTVADTNGLATLNNLFANPSTAYVNLHTEANPAGAVRAQLGKAPATPIAAAVAANVSTIKNLAPGSLISIYGVNLSAFATDLTGFYNLSTVPTALDGVSTTIGGIKAPVFYVSSNQINVQVPFEVQPGNTTITVTTAGGTSNVAATVTSVAPSIFIIDGVKNLGTIVKGADFSLINASNTVKPGDLIVIYLTGLGQTTPAVATGTLVVPPSSTSFNNTVPVTVTIDNKNATVFYSIASPGFVGLYQTAVAVPSGVSGDVPLVVSVGNAASNTATINVSQ